ncbi:hypothetical protein ACJX0J_018850, partial [Zea mays]
ICLFNSIHRASKMRGAGPTINFNTICCNCYGHLEDLHIWSLFLFFEESDTWLW